LGPLGTAATSRPIVPTPVDYDDGEIGGMIGRVNRSTRRKPAPVPLCPPQTPHACPDANPGRRGGKPATKLHILLLVYNFCKYTQPLVYSCSNSDSMIQITSMLKLPK
jgi:hypothetical protein